MDINIIYTIIKSVSINIFSILIFCKIVNYKNNNFTKNFNNVIAVICFSLCYVVLRKFLNIIFAVIVLYFFQVIVLKFITKFKLSTISISLIIAISLSYFIFIISGTIEFLFQSFFHINNHIINLIITAIIEFFILLLLNEIKRLKNGLTFLQKENEYIDIAMTNISAILLISYCLLNASHENLTEYMYTCFIIFGIFLVIMIQKSLVLCYKQKLLNKTIKEYEDEINQKDEIIENLSNEKFKISKLNHEFYNRQKALELKVAEMNLEVGEEIGTLERINKLTNEYSNKLEQIKGKPKLQLTNIEEIDDIFKYMQTECYNNNIEFKLQIKTDINKLVKNKISKNKLETLIGDHIKDAIIAINNSKNKYKSILVILGVKDNCYELCIYDTGIEFEIETLLKLGLEAVTTHKDIGGSGIGFITTFETLKECKASLIIKEMHQECENDYTKSVIIRFDDKNEYKICSYRSNEIRKENPDNRIILESL